MLTQTGSYRRYAAPLVAVILICTLYGFARLPTLSETERATLAARFRFSAVLLPEVTGPPLRVVRPVHPSLAHISAWISSVGAAVALHDLDGDGFPNDVCYVDTRTDQVIVAPVPGTPARYTAVYTRPCSPALQPCHHGAHGLPSRRRE